MKINRENQFMRIQLLTNANLGTASGKVTLDRPTQIDANDGLPYLPNSALKGVLRASSTSLSETLLKTTFGAEGLNDEKDYADHSPGKLIIGNADLLTFPILSGDGSRCWVFPLNHIYKFIELERLYNVNSEIGRLIDGFDFNNKNKRTGIGLPRLPILDLPFTISQIDIQLFNSEVEKAYTLLQRWTGGWIKDGEIILIADNKTTSFLWQMATEIRSQTSLKKKIAKSQSLRTIETIPEGSIFMAFITCLMDHELEFAEQPLQLGAEESCGLGFCQMEIIEKEIIPISTPQIDSGGQNAGTANKMESETMREIYKAVISMRPSESDEFKKKLKTAIKQFGWRVINECFEAAVAFELAKAKPSSSKSKTEMCVHRRLLALLFNIDKEQIIGQYSIWFSNDFKPIQKRIMMQRWLWLRKYSEYELEV